MGKKDIKKDVEVKDMVLDSESVIDKLKNALQVEGFDAEIEFAERKTKEAYKIDEKKLEEVRVLIASTQEKFAESHPTWDGVPITVKDLCELFDIEYKYPGKKKLDDGTFESVEKTRTSLPEKVILAASEVNSKNVGLVFGKMSGGIKDKESGDVMPSYWLSNVDWTNVKETEIDEKDMEVESEADTVSGEVEEVNLTPETSEVTEPEN